MGARNANDVAESYYQERIGGKGGSGRDYSPRSPSGGDYSPNYNRNKKTSAASKKSMNASSGYYKEKERNYEKLDEYSSASYKDRLGGGKPKKSHKNGHSKERYGRDDYGGRDYYRDDVYSKHKR